MRWSISNQQQGARQVSTKQHLIVTHVPARPLALDRQMTTATIKHTVNNLYRQLWVRRISGQYLFKKSSRGQRTPNAYDATRDECMPLTGSSVDTVELLRPSCGAAQLQEERILFPLYFVSKTYGTTLLHAIKYVTDQKHIVCNRASLCVVGVVLIVRTCIACTSVQTISTCPNLYNTTLEAPGTQLLATLLCGFFWGSNRNHYYLLLVLVMRALVTSLFMYVRVPTEIQ